MALLAATVTAVMTLLISVLLRPDAAVPTRLEKELPTSPSQRSAPHSGLYSFSRKFTWIDEVAPSLRRVNALCLEELIDSNPILIAIDHQNVEDFNEAPEKSTIHKALKMFQEARGRRLPKDILLHHHQLQKENVPGHLLVGARQQLVILSFDDSQPLN